MRNKNCHAINIVYQAIIIIRKYDKYLSFFCSDWGKKVFFLPIYITVSMFWTKKQKNYIQKIRIFYNYINITHLE